MPGASQALSQCSLDYAMVPIGLLHSNKFQTGIFAYTLKYQLLCDLFNHIMTLTEHDYPSKHSPPSFHGYVVRWSPPQWKCDWMIK